MIRIAIIRIAIFWRKNRVTGESWSDDETMADNDPNSTTAVGGGGVGATTASTTTAAMLNQPIVIDCGSSSMKAGFAGGTKPKVR